MPVMILLLAGLVVSAVACVVIRNLLKASIALSLTSAILAIIMFLLDAPLAAVFELSVCAGLVTVVFISAVSMTRVHSKEELAQRAKARRKRFVWLPVILLGLLAGVLVVLLPQVSTLVPSGHAPMSAITEQDFFWNKRQADMLGQIVIVLAAVYGVLIFFKEKEHEEK